MFKKTHNLYTCIDTYCVALSNDKVLAKFRKALEKAGALQSLSCSMKTDHTMGAFQKKGFRANTINTNST